MAKILSGKEVAAALKDKLTEEVKKLKEQGKALGLCIVMAGDRPDSASYIKGAVKRCTDIGIDCQVEKLPEEISQDEFLKVLDRLNKDPEINGIIIMRPLPSQISEDVVKYKIAPEKDVDCFSPINVSKVMSGDSDGFAPCTPAAVIEILDYYGIGLEGKRAVLIGRSMVVGRPLAMMLLKRNATVTICHTRTKNLPQETQRAEILIAAAGKARMVTKDMVSEGAVVIDVGINFDENGKMCGDVDFDSVSPIAGQITPVPGGVGSVTSTVLAKHVIEAFKLQQGL
ncbi:MAG: bifunctional 5,10-methylene-tetrahydrofolate dehydrogenase/5,10-methylene-tetrahydrofolate cyclohydrolase [Tepidanaerobacter acetatoxydans]|uniref:bifunctional 5,10-methylenetetrahydrofolate dehydrogenase/5,10-methenyltetrahydrofolate cyclohydrolase n=1 Tax=Tepidanaerobacter acetatoxydans TaxID=499229 RepID=UPI0026F00235|nr:tetrahydrofolate dehydrogenase/cyclohydrolase catalytic domain-containing protein [Tepidanaerobacter acetatoxydans]NLU09519.1 bifunctional 5,10-methylene-tetrahydrofolate dehydrogenase/5,10-methylene-tetrahydrofolate cyclohydrolase [Tepidanaerobacter acetatoxydans]